jgi:acyl-CoA synthetase (AMP-forming)/AMP-acid ligase II
MLSLSSGTTSTARAAEITHDQAQAFCLGFRVGSGFHHRARYLSVLPLSFAAGRDRLLLYLTSGGTVVLAPPLLSPEEVVARIVGHDIAATVMVPHLLRRLLEIAPEDGLLLPGLEFFESTGDKLAGAEKLEIVRRLSPNLYESYANSAVGLISCLRPADLAAHPDSVGRTNPLLEVEIIDDADRPLPAGEVGALRCRGPSLTQSGDHIDIRGGWLYPGDLGTIDGDGFLYLKGRATGLIKRRGTSIYPEEVESVLAAHPAVAEAAVVGRPAPDVGHDIVAYVATTGALSMAELRSYLIAELAGYKQPQEIVVLDRLPRTSSGKVNRGELTERAAKAGA